MKVFKVDKILMENLAKYIFLSVNNSNLGYKSDTVPRSRWLLGPCLAYIPLPWFFTYKYRSGRMQAVF